MANIWESALNVKAVYTETRAVPFVEMPVKKFEIDAANGIITVIASGENLSEPFFTGVQEASVRLAISDGNSSVVSEYIPMIAKYDETIINEDAIIDGVLYIATAQGLTKLKDTSIVSAELIATIDMAGESWTPIVNFAGVFDGNINKGYVISKGEYYNELSCITDMYQDSKIIDYIERNILYEPCPIYFFIIIQ